MQGTGGVRECHVYMTTLPLALGLEPSRHTTIWKRHLDAAASATSAAAAAGTGVAAAASAASGGGGAAAGTLEGVQLAGEPGSATESGARRAAHRLHRKLVLLELARSRRRHVLRVPLSHRGLFEQLIHIEPQPRARQPLHFARQEAHKRAERVNLPLDCMHGATQDGLPAFLIWAFLIWAFLIMR
jgi:hypothetical protein